MVSVALMLAIFPVQAFSASHIDYTIDNKGNALVTADYELSFTEKLALNTDIAKNEFTKALKTEYGDGVEVIAITETRTQFSIKGFADIRDDNSIVAPCLNFQNIKDRIDKYWFTKYLGIDYSPTLITMTFANGKSYSYNDVLFIPSLSDT
jgi:hypothetical protein